MNIANICIRNLTAELTSYSKSSLKTSTCPTKNPSTEKFVRSYMVVLCGMVFLAWYVQWLWNRRYLYIRSRNVPGPIGLPFIGAAYLFLPFYSSNIMNTVINYQRKYPDIAASWFGTRLYYVVSRPEHIEKILTSPKALEKDDFMYKFISDCIGEGLLTSRVPKWKKHRKMIRPAFNLKVLNAYQEVFLRKGEVFVDQLQKHAGNKDLDILELISNCTLDMICETALGLDMEIQTKNSYIYKTMDKLIHITTHRCTHIWHHLEFTWKFYPLSKEFDRQMKIFKNFTSSVFRQTLEAYNNKQRLGNAVVVPAEEESPKRKMAFLYLILENKNFTEKELLEEIELFLVAGTDTTATALSCIFTLLGMFQDVQKNVLEEVLAILGTDRSVLPSDLPEMKYTERVIKESLRLFPVGPFLARTIVEDIDTGDMIYPAGSSALFGIVHVHRNPKYWVDPLKFDPDRFLPENVAKRQPCTYIPFSYGPRNCIGGQYAIIAMKTILATVIRRFKIYTKYKTIEEINFENSLILRLTEGPKVWVEAR